MGLLWTIVPHVATEQKRVSTYLPAVDAERLRSIAASEGRTPAGLLRLLVRRYLEAEPTGSPQQARTVGSDSKGP